MKEKYAKKSESELDMKNRVMDEIKRKKICILSSKSILAKKLGLECVMVASLLAGTFFVSLAFYILKKTKVLKFLFLGMPGLKVFLLTIPYGYIAAFLGVLILILYISNKLDLPYETKISCGKLYLMIFGTVSTLMAIFIIAGIHDYYAGIASDRIPKERAVLGRVQGFSDDYLIIEENGQIVKIKIKEGVRFDEKTENIRGKYLRAVGTRDPEDVHYFQAESILCCDND